MDLHTIDGETFARRRDRRVSFAETTAVHVFDRDDSLGTPPKNDSNTTLSPCSDSGGDDSSRDTRDDGDDEDDDQDYEDGMAVPPVRFIRDMTDSSPGSASAVSVASNDDDNFFGPVSRSFMDSGGLSDSGISEDNNNMTHDITLDSTAFSLHFRNIGGDDRSANSAGSLLTTPNVDSKTPFVRGSITELSGANDMVGRLKFSDSMSSAGLGDSSLLANNSSKYNYGMLSATLNDLLREVDDSMKPVSPVSCPIDVQMDLKGDGARLLAGEVSHPTDASVSQNADGSKPSTGKDPHPIDISIYKNGDAAKPLTEEVACPIDVSVDKNGDGVRPLMGEVSHLINVSIDENGDSAYPPTGDVSHPVDVSMDQNGDGAQLLTGEDSHPVHFSIDENGDGAKPLIGEDSAPVDVLMNQNGDDVKILKGKDPHPIDASIDKNSDGVKLVIGDVSLPVDVSMVQNGDDAKLVQMEDPHPIDGSIDKNSDGAKLVTGEVSLTVDVSMVQNGDGAKLVQMEDPHPIDGSIDKNSDGAKLVTGEVSLPVDVRMFQNGDGAKLVQMEDPHPIDGSIDKNSDGAKLVTGEISLTVDVLMVQNGDGGKLVQMEDPHPIDDSVDKNSDGAKLVTGEVSLPVDVPMLQNCDGGKLVQREDPHPMDVSIDKNSDVAKLVAGEVSFPVDVSMVQNGDGAKLLQREDPHPTDNLIDKNGNDAKLVTGEVSHAIDASMEKNVHCNKLLMSGTHAFDDELANEKDEDHSEDMHEDFRSNTIPHSPRVTATSFPRQTISLLVDSAIALSSPYTTVQHPECKLPMITPKVAQLSETRQSPYIRSELFKHSERISAIKESILRVFPKGNIASTRLDFENENLPPSQSPVEKVVSNKEFDLEGRKRKLQQILGRIEDHPAKHAKPSAYESQEHDKNPQNWSLDRSKLVEDMSEITRLSFSPSVQKLTVQELGSLSGMMEKFQLSRKYERLSAFLKNCDSADQRQQRLAEARSLHDKLLYEKAKLELNRLKLNKLHSKAELACKRVQECHLLKSRISDLCCSNPKEAYNEHDCFPTNSVSLTQAEQDRLISKRKALKAIEQNIINLGAAFRVSCKIVEDLSCDDIINIAKEHLKLKNTHSIVQGDVKLWKLHDIVKQDKSCEIVLDYTLLFQRFTLGTGKSGSILVNTTLKKTKILQAFRDMNAHSAIEFVFRAKFTGCNIDSLRLLRQETLETSLLLGNVIHMLHEVQAAKRELLNLTSTNFNCKLSNTNMLELQLCFMNFKRGRKVFFSLDLSDLKFARYPSESSELRIEIDPTMTTFDEVLLKEIKALVQRLPTGRMMVLRLCRAVSEYVHSSYM